MGKILVVDDDETFSLMLCSALREAGHDVSSAFSGGEGIKTALKIVPDLVVLDYNLGDMTGYEVAVGIRVMQATSRTPFMLLSSIGDDRFMKGAFRKLPNCKATFVKNQPLHEILAAVDALLVGEKVYLSVNEKVEGPYPVGEVLALFPGLSPETLVCGEAEFLSGKMRWRRAAILPELGMAGSMAPQKISLGISGRRSLRLQILSISDDSGGRTLLWDMLSSAGHTVDLVKDEEELLGRLTDKRYDLVILDVGMSKMKGDTVSKLLQKKLARPPKILIFTDPGSKTEGLQFSSSGAEVIFDRGDDNDRLLKTIEKLFAGGKEAQEVQPPGTERSVAESGAGSLGPQAQVQPGWPAELLAQILEDNKMLKEEQVEVRRFLGHMELEYGRLEKQFGARIENLLEENSGATAELRSDWRRLKWAAMLALLLSLLAVLADVLLKYVSRFFVKY